jgi:hypothetical protein
MQRSFTDLEDIRLVTRGNKVLSDLFSKSVHSIRQISRNESDAKAFYRFLQNERVSEANILANLVHNCQAACAGKFVICIQDTSEVNLSSHSKRINKDGFVGTTNAKGTQGLGFFIHPSLVLDAVTGTPYGYSDIKIWNRSLEFKSKHERQYAKLPIEEKESYKWIEVSKNTQASLKDVVEAMVIVQDREGDIYEQFATIPDAKTDLLIRARANRTLADKSKLFSCLLDQPCQGSYEIQVDACANKNTKKRTAKIEIRYKEVELNKTEATSKGVAPRIKLHLIEAKEINYTGGKDKYVGDC